MLPVLSAFFRLPSSEYFCPETIFSASDHRGFFSVRNDSLLPLSICFLIFLLRLSFFEFIAIYHRQHTIFAFPVEAKEVVNFIFCLGIAFTFSTLGWWIRWWWWWWWWWWLRWIFSRWRDKRDNSSLFHIHVMRTTTGMFLVRVSTDKFVPYCHTLYLLLRTGLFKFWNSLMDSDF